MNLYRMLLCSSYGEVFEVIRFDEPVSAADLTVAAAGRARPLPVRVYPLDLDPAALPADGDLNAPLAESAGFAIEGAAEPSDGLAAPSRPDEDAVRSILWLIKAPLLDEGPIALTIDAGGHRFGYAFDAEEARSRSERNFELDPALCETIVDHDRRCLGNSLHPRLLHYYEDDDSDIWRFEVVWSVEGPKPDLEFALTDATGAALDFTTYFFEFQHDDTDPDAVHDRAVYSLQIPSRPTGFLLDVSDASGRCAAGFCSMNDFDRKRHQWGSWIYMRNVDDTPDAYRRWFEQSRPSDEELAHQRAEYATADGDAAGPLISLVVALEDPDPDTLKAAVESVRAQTYGNWELIIINPPDGEIEPTLVRRLGRPMIAAFTYWGRYIASLGDPRIRLRTLGMHRGYPIHVMRGIEAARGSWIVFMDEDRVLEPDCLYRLVKTAAHYPEASLIYGDDDVIDDQGLLVSPTLRGKLNLDLLYSMNEIGRFFGVKRGFLGTSGLPGPDVGEAFGYELALRVIAAGGLAAHTPFVLSHRREPADPADIRGRARAREANEAGRAALERHLIARGIGVTVEFLEEPDRYRVHYPLPKPTPLVSVVIPNKDHIDVLEPCVRSLLDDASYPALEIVVVENNSTEPDTFDFYRRISSEDERVRIVTWEGPFNYSAIINFGVAAARGDFLLLLNNDTKLISPDAIEEMVGLFDRPEVGVVGGKLHFRDGLVQHAGMLVNTRGIVAHVNQNFSRRRGGYREMARRVCDFSSVTGACQLVSRAVFDEVGGYEETLAVGFNDVDFCLKAQAAGYLVVFTPYAEFYHYEFTSRGRELADQAKLERWRRERDWMHERWPEAFTHCDPYLSPNLDKDNFYYNLPAAFTNANED